MSFLSSLEQWFERMKQRVPEIEHSLLDGAIAELRTLETRIAALETKLPAGSAASVRSASEIPPAASVPSA